MQLGWMSKHIKGPLEDRYFINLWSLVSLVIKSIAIFGGSLMLIVAIFILDVSLFKK